LQTCVREGIAVTAVVFNNGQWGAEKKNHVDFYDQRFLGVNLDRQPSWAAVARAMGAEGQTIDKLADVGPALRAAARAQADGRTTVLEMMVTRELGDPFRRDALALPVPLLASAQGGGAQFTKEQLDQLTAPIALYPDSLLSQVLMASTYPTDVVEAAKWSRANADKKGDDAVKLVEDQPWDPSVQ